MFKFPKYTLLLTVITVGFYFVFSNSLLFIPNSTLLFFGFSLTNLLGLVTYSFVHISPNHLFGNVLLLLTVGVIAEQKLSGKDFLIVYFLSGATSAFIFSLLQPDTVLVGASAAISGLVTTSFIVNIKRSVAGMIAFTLIVYAVGPVLMDYTQNQLQFLSIKTSSLEQAYNQTIEKLNEAIQTNNTEQIQNLTQQANSTFYELNQTSLYKVNLEQGIEREQQSRTSTIVHLIGAFTGLGYIFFFRRQLIWELPDQVIPKSKKKKG